MLNANPAVDLDAVARRFAHRWVLRGVSLRVAPGEVLGLTGRNGSGKTTLLRILTTLLRPTRGGGRVFGHDLARDRERIRPLIGYLGHAAGLYDDLTALENLRFSIRMAGVDASPAELDAALDHVRLAEHRDERARGFSAGMRRRLGVARLLLRPPRLLLLDEPYASFDSEGIDMVNAFAAQVAAEGGAAVVATHDVIRGAGVLTRTVHLDEGRLATGAVEATADLLAAPAGAEA